MSTSLSLFDLKPGKVLLDRYKIQQPHREGSISATFAVEDAEDGSSKELQVFHAGLFEGPDQGKQFAERIEGWQRVTVDGIAHLHSVEALDDGAVLLLTSFPEGPSLRTWLKEGSRMSPVEVVQLGKRMLGALQAVHAHGLIHGDIKPSSMHLPAGGDGALLVDAGITPAMWAAKHLGTRTALIGTPFYAPIEQFTGDSPDELSDLYNLSTVMYELLTGVLPWSGTGYIEVFQSKMQPRPPAMSQRAPEVEVPHALEEVIATGLSANRRERHPDAATFFEQLSSVGITSA